jgi:hypothetical protein
MKINTSTQSFTSLNKAIKVTKLDDTNSSSSKKLDDAVSLNISSSAVSNTTTLLNSLKEETVIQSRNGYVNPEGEIRKKILQEHYLNEVKINNQFEDPYAHLWDKYENPSSPYYIQGLTKEERNAAHTNEFNFQKLGKNNGYFNITDPLFRNSDDSSFYGDVDVARRKEFDRQKVNGQFQSLLDKYNISIPQDTKLTFTIDPNTLKTTVSGSDDETLTKSIENAINTAENTKQLFYHIISSVSDDSTQYNGSSDTKFGLTQNIKDATGYTLKDLEIKDGKFITPDGTDIAEIYAKKANENLKMSEEYKMMIISADTADLKKLAKDGFDSVPDLVLSIEYQNGSFYDVKQSENFGTGETDWIDKLQASKPKKSEIIENTETSSNISENIKEPFENIPKVIEKTKKEDEKHILTKDELMLKHLLENLEKEKKENKKSLNS